MEDQPHSNNGEKLKFAPVSGNVTNPSLQEAPKDGLFAGRIGRVTFLLSQLYLLAMNLLVFSILLGVTLSRVGLLGWLAVLLGAFIVVVDVVLGMSLNVRRLHDFNQSGFLVLFIFIPFAGFILGLFLLFKPGDPGPNNYGLQSNSRKLKNVFGVAS